MRQISVVTREMPGDTWEQVCHILSKQLLPDEFDTWFEGVRMVGCNVETVQLEVPGSFRKGWIELSYGPLLHLAFGKVLGRDIHVELIAVENHKPPIPEPVDAPPVSGNGSEESEELPPISSYQVLHSNYRFENFVVGMDNKMAHAAALSVARAPSDSYNPLFIYGGVGLGKTHLMQAIGHYVAEYHPNLRFIYISANRFLTEYVESIKRNERFQFQTRFRGLDVLLIDDIHFLAGKEGTQEEFFHTFNELHNNHKQIVISSDKPPREIQKLEERLRSRFEWGLITEISSPDFETRLAILSRKAEKENIQLPGEVLEFVAGAITSSIRELESALIRLGAHAKFSGTKITPEIARQILGDLYNRQDREISIDKIQKHVAEHFRVKASDIRGRSRSQSIVVPRQIAMYLSRVLTTHSLPEIGVFFGNKDHTTVLFACRKVEKQMKEEPEFKAFIQGFLDAFQ
ncbi:MAG TPA: chromosomal replication initiator protein DnaA [bacterium]|nr:chromosomal replication initiator protein DnaA [bacterium]HQL62874.1 chromosomal replication initiator protein DnaA [bacterium]